MAKTGLKPTDDTALALAASTGDEKAFNTLFEKYKAPLAAFLSTLVPQSEIDDLRMQTFSKAFLHIDSYNAGQGSFITWLYSIGRNAALDWLDKNTRQASKLPTTSMDAEEGNKAAAAVHDTVRDIESQLATQEEYERLVRLIDGLGDLYRDVARDRFLEEKELADIAAGRGLPLNTVKTRVSRAKKILCQLMEENEDQ